MSKFGVGVGDDFPIDESNNGLGGDSCSRGHHEMYEQWQHHRGRHRGFRRHHGRHLGRHHYRHGHRHSAFFRWSFVTAKILLIALIGAEIGGHFAVSLVDASAHMIGVLVGAGVAAFLAVLFAWSHRGHHHHFDAETNPEATSTTSISAQQNPSIQDNEK